MKSGRGCGLEAAAEAFGVENPLDIGIQKTRPLHQ